ncbi:putative Cation efflux system protein [Candidatus Sulfotelmatomonas gaucii]|uniref:Putative Cation efflux system protein n=1 Tax=Candidatus Sulfuritelmatomonas gaucii TaxID=2043161 RepID=A0A2N9LSX9_9BACT|nr:putative Cation efflux system protein [Candidatus Sulfotelmatomonas gaucii]
MRQKQQTNRNRTGRSRARILAALALAAASTLASAQVSLTTVVEMAQQNSSSVKLANADLQKAQAALDQTEGAYIPDFVIGSQVGYSHGFPTGQPSVGNASMQSLVLSFSQRQYVKAARAGVEAANLNLKDAKEQVALDASTDYIELDTVKRELDAVREQEQDAARLVAIEQQRAEAGVDPLSALLQAELTAAQLKFKRLQLETRAATLAKQLEALTALPADSIATDRSSIPEIPAVSADQAPRPLVGIESSTVLARSKLEEAKGDDLAWRRPSIGFGAVYNYDSNELNNYSTYYNHFTPNNVSFGLQISVPFFNFAIRAKAKVSAAEALRARVEAEDAQHQNDIQIATLTASVRELDAQSEIASLKQQLAAERLKSVAAQLELGNGAAGTPGAPPQLSPTAEQQAQIQERQDYLESLDAGFDLSKARLSLLRALGHMQDWLNELNTK